MKTHRGRVAWVVGCCILPLLLACEDEKPKSESKAAAPPSAAPVATPTPSAAAAAAPTEKTTERPTKVETELTPARRAAIEAKYPEAKGFLVGSELETKLKADKALKDKKSAIAAFDRAAKGKWVLFASPLVNLTDDGFDFGVVYTPQLPGDAMGMSRQFFEVTLSQVDGYSKDAFKAGNMVVVLTKYNGAGKASPGHELIAADVWK